MAKNDDYIRIRCPKELTGWLKEFAAANERTLSEQGRHIIQAVKNLEEKTAKKGRARRDFLASFVSK